MGVTDVAVFVGAYPYRSLTHDDPAWVVSQMDRLGIERAWVSHFPSLLLTDPASGTRALRDLVAPYDERLFPVPILNPASPTWRHDLQDAKAAQPPAVRLMPQYHGVDPAGPLMREVVATMATLGLPLLLTVRLEDARQRHPSDTALDLPAAAVRALMRVDSSLRCIVTHADRSYVEEVHFGLTPAEAARVLWDISWIWGPPENHLALVLDTVGADRFVLGTGMSLRIPDTPFAKLDLLEVAGDVRRGILSGNLLRWLGPQ